MVKCMQLSLAYWFFYKFIYYMFTYIIQILIFFFIINYAKVIFSELNLR